MEISSDPGLAAPRRGDRSYLSDQLARDLAGVAGSENVSADPAVLADEAADWSWMSLLLRSRELPLPTADLAVWPGDAAEVEAIVRIAADYRVPVIPRGGGTGTQGGTFAPYGGIVVDLTRLNRILEVDRTSFAVTAEAGVDGAALEKELSEVGLTLAHYPGSQRFGATVGGYLAARGSGVLSTKYGKAEDMVMQVKAVVPPGRTISTLPIPNHAAGPDLLQTLIGSEGTLGIITQATMRVDPVPPAREFLSFRLPSVESGIEVGRRIMTERIVPAAMRLYDEADSAKLGAMLDVDVDGVLLIIVLDGAERSIAVERDGIEAICARSLAVNLGPGPARSWWEGRDEPFSARNFPAPPTVFGTTDTCARFADLPRLYRAKKRAIESGFAALGARYTAHFSHWYPWGAMIYDRFYVDDAPSDPAEALELHDRLWDAAVGASLTNGGIINDHHGVGLKLGRFMRPQYGPAFDLMVAIKNAWDPDGIMNPGKLGFGPPRSAWQRF